MRKEDYKVALIVPVYNEHETIDTFLDTVYEKLASELNHLEIVFVDDGSKDDTVQIIHRLLHVSPFVRQEFVALADLLVLFYRADIDLAEFSQAALDLPVLLDRSRHDEIFGLEFHGLDI